MHSFSILIALFSTIFYATCAKAEFVNPRPKPVYLIPKIEFYPNELNAVMENQLREVSYGITWENTTDNAEPFLGDYHVFLTSEDTGILEIINTSYSTCIKSREEPRNFTFTVKGKFLGYTKVTMKLRAGQKNCLLGNEDLIEEHSEQTKTFQLVVSVIRKHTLLVDIVTGVMASLVAFNYINMGVQLDLHRIGKVLKKPIGPTIGFVCQFLFMPVASYGISLLLLDDLSLRLGLFTLGCSPGGSMSNFWTLLFNGDVNLSVTMTFISTIAALAMMPLWIFTLGSSLFRNKEATIPYLNLAGSLILLTVPIGIGLLIQQRSPRLSKISRRIIKPFTIVCVLVGISVGLYANSFVFSLFSWQVVLAGVGIAWGGYCFGALMAWLFRLDRSQIVAVSIETAFQNPAVAFVLLVTSLPQPDADLSSVPVIAQLMLTGLPMWALLVLTRIYKQIKTCYQKELEDDTEKPEIDTVEKAYMALGTQMQNDDEKPLEIMEPKIRIVRATQNK